MSSPLSPEELKILSSPPFVTVEGVINIRDAGGQLSSTFPDKRVKSGYIFRAGEPSRITEKGMTQLRDLGVKVVFDLRSDTEIADYKAALVAVDGIDFIRAPVSRNESYDPVSLAIRVRKFELDFLESFIKLYMEIIDHGGHIFEQILIHLRDKPEAPCLIHCTAGKDRTGTLVAAIQLLLGVSDEEIINDYALTTVGLAPALPMLVARFQATDVFRDNWAGTMNLASSRPETMVAFLKAFRDKYKTIEDYVKEITSLSDEDIEQIRKNLLVSNAEPLRNEGPMS